MSVIDVRARFREHSQLTPDARYSTGRGDCADLDLSEPVEYVYERRHGQNRHEHDDGRHGSDDGNPGTSGPSCQPRPRDQDSCGDAGLERHAMLGGDGRADALLAENCHSQGFASRADPVPPELPASLAPVVERLDALTQFWGRKQPFEELVICRSGTAHGARFIVSCNCSLNKVKSAHRVGHG